MAKTIKIRLAKSGVIAVARLEESLAPKTSQAFWEILPIEGKVTHAKWGGNEIWTSTSQLKTYEPENETILPSPKEILIVPVAPNTYDLAIWYGKGWCFGPSGFLPGNHVATIIENFEGFAKECSKLLIQGSDKIIIEKGEEK